MGAYIQAVAELSEWARNVSGFPEAEIQAAIAFLARCPVAGYPPYDEDEVRLVAAYLAESGGISYNQFWRGMVAGYAEAWSYAVHEAAELQAFADAGVNPFDAAQRRNSLKAAHLQATIVELRFLSKWARQRQFDTSEMAIELANPIRSQLSSHRELAEELQAHQSYPAPTPEQLESARQFWRQITQE